MNNKIYDENNEFATGSKSEKIGDKILNVIAWVPLLLLIGGVITFIISLFSYAASVDDYNAKIIDTIESIKVLSDEVKSYDNNDTGDLDILLSKAYYEIKGSRKFFDTSENKISRTIASLADVQLYIKDINKDNDEYLNKIYDTVQEKITTLESLERP